VEGIAVACVPDPASELVNLLDACIRDTASRVPPTQHEPAAAERHQQAPSLR
jgi:hypothetical protein